MQVLETCQVSSAGAGAKSGPEPVFFNKQCKGELLINAVQGVVGLTDPATYGTIKAKLPKNPTPKDLRQAALAARARIFAFGVDKMWPGVIGDREDLKKFLLWADKTLGLAVRKVPNLYVPFTAARPQDPNKWPGYLRRSARDRFDFGTDPKIFEAAFGYNITTHEAVADSK